MKFLHNLLLIRLTKTFYFMWIGSTVGFFVIIEFLFPNHLTTEGNLIFTMDMMFAFFFFFYAYFLREEILTLRLQIQGLTQELRQKDSQPSNQGE